MGKKALDATAKYLTDELKKSQKYREEESNYKVHEFSLTPEDLQEELLKQLSDVIIYSSYKGKKLSQKDFKAKLLTICETATPKILAAVAKKSPKYVITPLPSGAIRISTKDQKNNTSDDIFRYIRDKYRPTFNEHVKNVIVKELFSSFNETEEYKKAMSRSYEEYERGKKSNEAYDKQMYALNTALFGHPHRITRTDEQGNEIRDYKRSNGQIDLYGGSANLGHKLSVAQQRSAAALDSLVKELEAETGTLKTFFAELPELAIEIIKVAKNQKSEILGTLEYSFDVVLVGIESAKDNQLRGTNVEASIIKNLAPTVRELASKHPWATQEGSDSPIANMQKLILNSAIDSLVKKGRAKLTKGKKERLDSKPSKGKSTLASSKKTRLSNVKRGQPGAKIKAPTIQEGRRETPIPRRQQNWSSLLPIINAKLLPKVLANMKAPALVNRTGTFAQSAKVVNIEQTREGFPSFVFDYERDPYDVFDRVKGRSPWNTIQRDPRALVDKSLREVVREMAISRFYTRRA